MSLQILNVNECHKYSMSLQLLNVFIVFFTSAMHVAYFKFHPDLQSSTSKGNLICGVMVGVWLTVG